MNAHPNQELMLPGRLVSQGMKIAHQRLPHNCLPSSMAHRLNIRSVWARDN
jgi:hypothetical protein